MARETALMEAARLLAMVSPFGDSRRTASFGSVASETNAVTMPGAFDGGDGGRDRPRSLRKGQLATKPRLSSDTNVSLDALHNAYDARIAATRTWQYPALKEDSIYLDHAGRTLPSKYLINDFAEASVANLYGNPHSGTAGSLSMAASKLVDKVRLRALRFFGASPDGFDLVFVANATAGIKLVADGIRGWQRARNHPSRTEPIVRVPTVDHQGHAMTWLGYHADAHTSLVGMREEFSSSTCFLHDGDVERWLADHNSTFASQPDEKLHLLAYPAQSNMDGRRLPQSWLSRATSIGAYTLLDAASYATTSPLAMTNASLCADFTVVSFYKIFGMPDLGAVIVKKSAGHLLRQRSYFGGGTVEMVSVVDEQWHIAKQSSLHEVLEDGTLPITNIQMLNSAFNANETLYESMDDISWHTTWLADHLFEYLSRLKHWNGVSLCKLYGDRDKDSFGPIVAFNIQDSRCTWFSNYEVEKMASVRDIQLRVGGLCNPGGVTKALDLKPWEMQANFSAGQRCGGEVDILNGKPTGVVRVSLGAMSTLDDIQRFIEFMNEFFVEKEPLKPAQTSPSASSSQTLVSGFTIESLTVYPIKSCGGFTIPNGMPWPLRPEGLAWDREWCIVHSGSGRALSQKRYTKMALLRPQLDFDRGLLTISYSGYIPTQSSSPSSVSVPLSLDPSQYRPHSANSCPTTVCGDKVSMNTYSSQAVNQFLSTVLETPCQLARIPLAAVKSGSIRVAKPELAAGSGTSASVPLALSNESPLLVISRSSLNRLNELIKQQDNPGRAVPAAVFRANMVISEYNSNRAFEQPYIEDLFESLAIRPSLSLAAQDHRPGLKDGRQDLPTSSTVVLDILGKCRRCQMICIDQQTGDKSASGEPFSTLAKTRRQDGKVWFGMHASLASGSPSLESAHTVDITSEIRIRAGDLVEARVRSSA